MKELNGIKVDTDDALLQQEDDHMKSHYTRELFMNKCNYFSWTSLMR